MSTALTTLKQQTLDRIRQQELELYSERVELYWLQQPTDQQRQFNTYRGQLIAARVDLENTELAAIAAQLKAHSREFGDGIDHLKRELATLRSTIAILNSLAQVTGVLSRIIGL